VSPDRIPIDIKDEIDEIFPKSTGRRRIAYALMFWDRKPNSKEKEELAQWAGFKAASTTHTILTKLKENGLFTDTVGSIPLSRSLLDIAVEKQQQQISSLTSHSPPPLLEETASETPAPLAEPLVETRVHPQFISDDLVENADLHYDSPPSSAQIDMKTRLDSAEKQIKHVERIMAAGFEDMKKLIGDIVNPLTAAPKANPLTVDPPDEAEEVETVVNPGVEESGPFADMTKQQVIDMAITSPDMIYALRNQGVPPTTETIQAVPHTTRWLALELTTYTQAAYERSVEDGYEGSLSDFINNAVYKYFFDRGKVLQWVDTMPRPQPYNPQPSMYPRRPLGD